MNTNKVEFQNSDGENLSARIELPADEKPEISPCLPTVLLAIKTYRLSAISARL